MANIIYIYQKKPVHKPCKKNAYLHISYIYRCHFGTSPDVLDPPASVAPGSPPALKKDVMNIQEYNMFQKIRESCGELNNKTDEEIMNLEQLSLESLTFFPHEICQLTNLTELNFHNNKLTCLPPEICQLVNLTKFDCSKNQLTCLPPEIGQLTNLTELNCCCNPLKSLPPEICQLTNLTTLICYFNQLTCLPPEICQLTNLTKLNCSYNQLRSLPQEICQLTNLTQLCCGSNQLTCLPPEIGQLTNLEHLTCSFNQLTSLPPEIGQLTNLTEFFCDYNQLTSLSPEIGQLTNLIYLDCNNNQLTSLPPEISQLVNLISFDYSNNPIEYIPPNLRRHLNRRLRNHQNLYNDRQSVHNSSIQESFRKSLNNLLRDNLVIDDSSFERLLNEITQDSVLTKKAKEQLIEYSENKDIHMELQVNFQEVLYYVWNRICNSKDGDQIKTILSQEMDDADCKCFTGRITRLVNTLNGFYHDIQIQINCTEQIGNIMEIIRNKLKNENQYTIEKFKNELEKALKERNYEEKVINEWLEYIE